MKINPSLASRRWLLTYYLSNTHLTPVNKPDVRGRSAAYRLSRVPPNYLMTATARDNMC
jgi:hypothetical protein